MSITCGIGAIERPDTPAIVFYGRVITYSEYDELSDRFAGWLLSLGVERGDRVGVHLVNCPQFHIAILGILKVGCGSRADQSTLP